MSTSSPSPPTIAATSVAEDEPPLSTSFPQPVTFASSPSAPPSPSLISPSVENSSGRHTPTSTSLPRRHDSHASTMLATLHSSPHMSSLPLDSAARRDAASKSAPSTAGTGAPAAAHGQTGANPAGRAQTTQLFAALLQRAGSVQIESLTDTTTQGVKRKVAQDLGGGDFDITSPSDVVLPKDPARRASIIHLATAAAAAVLQGQLADRRFSQQEHINKRQRTREQQLSLLAEQARMTHLMAARARTDGCGWAERASEALPSSLASPSSSSSAGVTANTASIAPHDGLPSIRAPSTSADVAATATERADSPATSSFGGAQGKVDADHAAVAGVDLSALRSFSIPSDLPPATSGPLSLAKPTIDPQHQKERESKVTSQGFLDEAKMVANHYGRFYRFEQEWAHRALALGGAAGLGSTMESQVTAEDVASQRSRQASPTSTLTAPTTGPGEAGLDNDDPVLPRVSPHGSPRQQPRSHCSTRYSSRATSPTSGTGAAESSRPLDGRRSMPSAQSNGSFERPSHGLVSVLSNFADLVKARQQSCSQLEALADKALVLPPAPGVPNGEHALHAGTRAGSVADDSDDDDEDDENDDDGKAYEALRSLGGGDQENAATTSRPSVSAISTADRPAAASLSPSSSSSCSPRRRPAEPMSIASMM